MPQKKPTRRQLQPSKVAAKASEIDKENDSRQTVQSNIMSNKRVLRKRPQKQVSMKEESSSENSEADSDSEVVNVKQKRKQASKSTQQEGKSDNSKKGRSKTVQSESDSDCFEPVNSKSEVDGPAISSLIPLPKSAPETLKEESSASESEDEMMDVFTKEEPMDAQESGSKDYDNQQATAEHTSIRQDSSKVGDVMDMLMACESTTTTKNIKNESDSEDNWEQVQTSSKPSPKKKSTKSRSRKRKLTENSDPDFEAKPEAKLPKTEEKTRKRKKDTAKTKEAKSDAKKPKKELSEAEKEIRRFTNRCLKDRDSCIEQCSLVLGVAFLRNVTRCSRKPLFQGLLLSLLPEKLHNAKQGLDKFVTSLLDWYRDTFSFKQTEPTEDASSTCSHSMMQFITLSETPCEHIYVAGFFTLLLVCGVESRFVGSLYVPSLEKVAKSTKLSSKAYPNPTYWVEAKDKDIILAIDVINGKMTEDAFVESKYVNPQGYVISITSDLVILDSTAKYVEKWSEIHRKARMLNHEFWDEFIANQPNHFVTLREHMKLMKKIMVDRGLPKSLGGFKHNLVFALEKDNLKIEAIYPKTAPVIGTFKSHNVYSRDNVRSLKQIIVIKKEGRQLKAGEVPYKIVKNKILYDRWPGDDRWKDLPLYGDWQTEWYQAPTAENGVVPRNEFGNVELFKPWMLPRNAEHVDLPGSYALARRLNIDAPHAVTGFEFPRCRAVPVMSGVVVCKEFAETLRNAWVEYNATQTQKAEDKRVKRIYDNWKTLIKQLLIKEKLSNKYEGMGKAKKPSKGHVHKFPVKSRRKDKVTGELVQKCSCGLVVPVASCEEEL